ncbi:MAG: hypothetical protein ACM3U1_01895 [Chloroflexota bacterium]
MKKIIRYIPRTSVEIEALKKIREEQEARREEKTNLALIALRRKYLKTTAENRRLEAKIIHFNKVIKTKPLPVLVKIIHYLVSDLNLENEENNATE